ncbi:hypothetical protein ACIA71_06560 [Streptomyces anulatus]
MTLPDDQHQVDALLKRLSTQAGPLATAPAPLPPGTRSLLTTAYLADAYFSGHPRQAAVPLDRAVQHVLAEGERP